MTDQTTIPATLLNPATDTITVAVPPAQPAPPTAGTFTIADLERARQEEKDKLYKRLGSADERVAAVEAELNRFRQERQEQENAAAETSAAAEAEEAARKKAAAESEMSARKLLESRSQEWETRFQQLQAEREQERAALAKEAEFAQLRAYIQERIIAEREQIAPELADLVSGDNREEIDASIDRLKAKTAQILESVQQAQQAARSQMRGVATTGFTGQGPLDNESGSRTFSAQDIKDMSMKDFARYRSQLLGKASDNPNRGLFD